MSCKSRSEELPKRITSHRVLTKLKTGFLSIKNPPGEKLAAGTVVNMEEHNIAAHVCRKTLSGIQPDKQKNKRSYE